MCDCGTDGCPHCDQPRVLTPPYKAEPLPSSYDKGSRDGNIVVRDLLQGSKEEKVNISETIKRAHANSRDKGFWDDVQEDPQGHVHRDSINTRLLLIVSEVTETMEALRKHNPYSEKLGEPVTLFEEEMADIAIRLFDLAGYCEIDLADIIQRKMDYNENRPHMHGKAF